MRVFNRVFSIATFLVLFSASATVQEDILLPELLGKHPVGTTSFELINTASSPSRDLMLFAFYPITEDASKKYPLARDFSPAVADFISNYDNDNLTDSGRIVTRAHQDAPICSTDFPILLFGPGYGEPVQFSGTQTMSNMASQGYIVIGVSHPNDSAIIEYPDGRVVYYDVNEDVPDFDFLIPFVDARVSDMNFIASQLRNTSVTKNIPGLTKELEFESLGTFGFSLGGASAASAMLTNEIYACGGNLDGAYIGNITDLGLDKPFYMQNSMTHTWPTDDTWPTFFHNLRGYKRDAQILGTRHKANSDWLILNNLLVTNDTDPGDVGLLRGTRMLEITNAYVTSFFDMCFKNGTGELLNYSNTTQFPEVQFLS